MNVGIDYAFGQANVDTTNGIRFGVISQNAILQAWSDSSKPVYPDEVEEQLDGDLVDEAGRPFEPDTSWLEDVDPIAYVYNGDGYVMETCLDSDVMVLKSDYYTFASFCSPCLPGAGNLDCPYLDGVKTFCLDGSWFEDEKAPYPVYKVSDGTEVKS